MEKWKQLHIDLAVKSEFEKKTTIKVTIKADVEPFIKAWELARRKMIDFGTLSDTYAFVTEEITARGKKIVFRVRQDEHTTPEGAAMNGMVMSE